MRRSLFGYGVTTKALASSGGWDIYDDSFTKKSNDVFGNKLLPPHEFNPSKSSLEIPSPGFPPNHHLIKSALNLQSEYDYFANQSPCTIWVSGTNGKTTTTQMITSLLNEQGAVSGGNIGTPLASLNPLVPIWVLETSSFTMHYTNIAKPDIYVLLPLREDHINWHGSLSAYIDAKLKPLSMMSSGSVAIIPKEYESVPTKAHLITYEDSKDLANFLKIDLNKIKIKEPFLLNSLLSLTATYVLNGELNIDKINSFDAGEHKLQELFDKKGRIWVNDSKGTNIDATIEALKRYQDKKIHIILGGDDKGIPLDRLFEKLKELNVEVYAIGSNANKLMEYSKQFFISATYCGKLDNAVLKIDSKLQDKEVALLSPAAASLDQFKSYMQRGERFIKAVNSISSY